MSKVARHCFRVTASPRSATLLSFPVLTSLELSLSSDPRQAPIVPDPVLGGSALFTCQEFHFQVYQNSFYLPRTLSILTLAVIPILGTFHPRRWPRHFSALTRLWKNLCSYSNRLDPIQTVKTDSHRSPCCLNGFLITVTRSLGTWVLVQFGVGGIMEFWCVQSPSGWTPLPGWELASHHVTVPNLGAKLVLGCLGLQRSS